MPTPTDMTNPLAQFQDLWANAGKPIPEGDQLLTIEKHDLTLKRGEAPLVVLTFKSEDNRYAWERYDFKHPVAVELLQGVMATCGVQPPESLLALPQALAKLHGKRVIGTVSHAGGDKRTFANIRVKSAFGGPAPAQTVTAPAPSTTKAAPIQGVSRIAAPPVAEPADDVPNLVGMEVVFECEGTQYTAVVQSQTGDTVQAATSNGELFNVSMHELSVARLPEEDSGEPEPLPEPEPEPLPEPETPKWVAGSAVQFALKGQTVDATVISADPKKGDVIVQTEDGKKWRLPITSLL